jgi:hypothetical protein
MFAKDVRNCYREKSRLIRTEEVRSNGSAEEFETDLSREELSSLLEFELCARELVALYMYILMSLNGTNIQFSEASFSSRNGQKVLRYEKTRVPQ